MKQAILALALTTASAYVSTAPKAAPTAVAGPFSSVSPRRAVSFAQRGREGGVDAFPQRA